MPRSLSGKARREMGRGTGTLVTGQVMVTVAVPQHFPTIGDEHDCPMGRRRWIWPYSSVTGLAFPMGRGCRWLWGEQLLLTTG